MNKRGEKVRCGGQWTEARYTSFIKSALRGASKRWGPKSAVKTKARTRRGFYRCAECKQEVPATLPPKPGNKRRINNAVVDHIHPVVDPAVGFVSWDEYIERMFCEEEGLQVLCNQCHEIKTQEEKDIAKARRSSERL